MKSKNNYIYLITTILVSAIFSVALFLLINFNEDKQKAEINVEEEKVINTNNRIKIPSVGISENIYQKYTNSNLNKGVVQQYSSAKPQKRYNYILAGHNLIYHNKLFTKLPEVKKGATVYIIFDKKEYIYKVIYSKRIKISNKAYLNTNTNKDLLTMYTCTNDDNEKNRNIVIAVLQSIHNLDTIK